jgi:membrane protein YqaA with SNARE-associated domain
MSSRLGVRYVRAGLRRSTCVHSDMQRVAGWARANAHLLFVQFGFVTAFVLLFGNEMLLISLFMSSLLTFLVCLLCNSIGHSYTICAGDTGD